MAPYSEETGSPSFSSLEESVRCVVEDVQRRTLDAMPSQFNRLVYLASLRDHNTGQYSHYGLECRYPSEAVSEGLRRCHVQTFREIIALPLEQQTRDLIGFFEILQADRTRLIEVWRRLRAYAILPPEECHPLAGELFRRNVETILQVLRHTALWELLDDSHRDAHHLP